MKGPECNDESALVADRYFLSLINIWIQSREAWDNRWCQRRSSFWGLDRFVFSWLRSDLTPWMACTLGSVYPKASFQKFRIGWSARGMRGRLLRGQRLAENLFPSDNAKSIPDPVMIPCPPNVSSNTWGLKRRTSAEGIWYPRSSISTGWPLTSCIVQRMIPSPWTLFDDDRSLILIWLEWYVRKSDRWGEMQTDAPVSTIMLERIVDPKRQRGESMDEMKIRCSRVEIISLSTLLAKVGRYDIDIALMISLGSWLWRKLVRTRSQFTSSHKRSKACSRVQTLGGLLKHCNSSPQCGGEAE